MTQEPPAPESIIWIQVALVIFVTVFIVIVIAVFMRKKSSHDAAARIPLNDDVPVTPREESNS